MLKDCPPCDERDFIVYDGAKIGRKDTPALEDRIVTVQNLSENMDPNYKRLIESRDSGFNSRRVISPLADGTGYTFTKQE